MATAVHIPFEELSADTRSLLERVNASGDIFVDGHGADYKISRLPGRTAADALAMLKDRPNADVAVDADWAKDMAEIIALRKTEPDPWA
jgi:hypothetical protein